MTRDEQGRVIAFAIYESPPQAPGQLVVHEHRMLADGSAEGAGWQGFPIDDDRDAALERARAYAKQRLPDAQRIPREENDDPIAVECWL